MALNVALRAWLPRTTARILPAIPWHGVLCIAAAIADVAALLLTLAGAHASACAGSLLGPTASTAPTCPGLLALPPFTPAAAFGLVGMVALGLAPCLTLGKGRRWLCVLAGAGQIALQLAGSGLFLLWLPALLLTAAAALV